MAEHILVVDDEAIVRATVARLLGRAGYHVHQATTPDEAATLARSLPNLAVLVADARIASEAGAASLADPKAHHPQMRSLVIAGQSARWKDVPVVTTPQENARLRRQGVSASLSRPFAVMTLAGQISELVAELMAERAAGDRRERTRRNVVAMVDSLAMALEARDPYTHGHSMRVSDYAMLIAQGFGLSDHELETLQHGAALHDIGKIAIKQEVLHKDGRLSNDEFEHIKTHPGVGREILEPMGDFAAMLDVVYHHHERMDGRGYPEGLQGKKIPVLAQIVAVADTYDAMTSDRPYRRGMAPERAFAVMREVAGTQLNAEFVAALAASILTEAPYASHQRAS